ncbi:MAG TPA: flagellar motor switch protein FliN [Micropepsaceae bacterium]|jgi:flagellar motor switch protein FliN/FliY|nr:flagellar motor switch protein FliN [Micropepsaceae bacterium]
MADKDEVGLPELNDDGGLPEGQPLLEKQDGAETDQKRSAADLEAVYDVPVTVQAILGKSAMEVSQLLKLARGTVVQLDRKVGEAIDIYVNDRLVARGEVVLVEDRLGVTMTEIIKSGQN